MRRTAPMWPDIRLPGNTRPGVWRWPIEPGARCTTEAPCEAMPPAKLWRFIVPAKPLPMVVPVTSTTWPGGEEIDLELRARRELRALAVGEAELDQRGARLDLRLAVVAGERPADPRGLAVAYGDLHRAVTVGFRSLDLGDAVGQRLDHGDRDRFAGVREDARHAALAANETDRHRYVLVHRPGCDWPGLRPPAAFGRPGKTIRPRTKAGLAGRQGALVKEMPERCGIGGPPAPLERYPQSGPDLGEKEPRIIAIRPRSRNKNRLRARFPAQRPA